MSTDWRDVRDELVEAVARVTTLLRSGVDVTRPAVGEWDLGEVATHLSQAWTVVPGLARDDLSELHDLLPERAGTAGRSVITDVQDLANITREATTAEPERDPRIHADRIERRAADFLASLDDDDVATPRPWLVEGIEVPVQVLLCHLLNETVVHGRDLAQAAGRPWPIERRTANIVVDGFVLAVISRLGADAVDPRTAGGLRATFDLRLRGGSRHHLRFHDGDLDIGPPADGPVDCHVLADPVSFLLVAWGRRSLGAAVVRGHLLAWGRRPWLAPQFRSYLIDI